MGQKKTMQECQKRAFRIGDYCCSFLLLPFMDKKKKNTEGVSPDAAEAVRAKRRNFIHRNKTSINLFIHSFIFHTRFFLKSGQGVSLSLSQLSQGEGRVTPWTTSSRGHIEPNNHSQFHTHLLTNWSSQFTSHDRFKFRLEWNTSVTDRGLGENGLHAIFVNPIKVCSVWKVSVHTVASS